MPRFFLFNFLSATASGSRRYPPLSLLQDTKLTESARETLSPRFSIKDQKSETSTRRRKSSSWNLPFWHDGSPIEAQVRLRRTKERRSEELEPPCLSFRQVPSGFCYALLFWR